MALNTDSNRKKVIIKAIASYLIIILRMTLKKTITNSQSIFLMPF